MMQWYLVTWSWGASTNTAEVVPGVNDDGLRRLDRGYGFILMASLQILWHGAVSGLLKVSVSMMPRNGGGWVPVLQ